MCNKIHEKSELTSVEEIEEEVKESLEYFDSKWTRFEHVSPIEFKFQLYVYELMMIESDARRFIIDAIKIEKSLTDCEAHEKQRGRIFVDGARFNDCRNKLVQLFNQINSVANYEGKGRDDLTLDILIQAESISRRIS
jgi:hypothetical protein